MSISDAELKELLETTRANAAKLEALTNENTELRGLLRDSAGPRVVRAISERFVNLRFVDGKAVIGFKNRGVDSKPQYVYEKVDPNDKNNRLLFVDLILEGGEVVPVDYNEFLREGEMVSCKVKETKTKEWELEQGYVKKKEVDEYSTVELPVDVPVEIKGTVRTFLVEIPAPHGPRELEIHEAYVNI